MRGDFEMNCTYFDDEVVIYLTKYSLYDFIEYNDNQNYYIELLEDNFSFLGSKIDWKKTYHHINAKYSDSTLIAESEQFIKNLQESLLRKDEKVVYISDGESNLVYTFDLNNILKLLPAFLSVPQHHYFMPLDCRWCICISTENHLDFGFTGGIRVLNPNEISKNSRLNKNTNHSVYCK